MKKVLFALALICSLALTTFAQIGPQPPEVYQMAVNSSQNGAYAQVTVTGVAPKGISDLTHLIGVIGTPYNSANTCTVLLLNQSAVLLLNDAGTAWLGWYAVGSNNTVENSQCKIPPGTTSVSINGSSATFHYDLAFKPSYNGLRPVYGVAADANWQTGNNQYGQTGWLGFGQFNVNAPVAPTLPQINSVTPASGSGSTYTFSASATAGSAGLGSIFHFGVVVGNPSTYDPRCMVLLLDRASIILLNDAGDGWLGWVPVGSNNVIENSTCKINAALTSVVISGNTVGFGGKMEFKSGLSGTTKGVSGLAADSNWGSAGGWVNYGNWTIPTGGAGVPGSTYRAEVIGGEVGPDNYSGDIKPLNTSDSPQQVAYISSPAGAYVVRAGDPLVLGIKYAKPNQQVWGRVFQSDPASHEPDGSVRYSYFKPKAAGTTVIYTTQSIGEVLFGGWLLGTTDAQGNFSLPVEARGFGGMVTHLYVGDMGTNGGATPGSNGLPSDGFISSLPDSKFVNAIHYWSQDSTGFPAAPSVP